jgi:hypothetical protein
LLKLVPEFLAELDEDAVDESVNLSGAGDTLSDVVRRLVESAFGCEKPQNKGI